MELGVMTFNLRINVKQDGANSWPNRILEAAEVIKESGASVICTQEGSYSMLKDLEVLLPEYAWIGQGRMGGHEDEHCAIFFHRNSLEVVNSGTFGLSEYPEQIGTKSWDTSCPRICTWIQLQKPDGQLCCIFNTHLDHMSSEAREKGIQLIVERMDTMRSDSGIPAVLAGDFNSNPDSDVIRYLNEMGLHNAFSIVEERAAVRTYHGFDGGETGEPIDYIFVTKEIRIESVHINRKKYNGRYPSDHYPVSVLLTI